MQKNLRKITEAIVYAIFHRTPWIASLLINSGLSILSHIQLWLLKAPLNQIKDIIFSSKLYFRLYRRHLSRISVAILLISVLSWFYLTNEEDKKEEFAGT
ncbi:MAG: hypothetical protein ACK4ND_15335 [Cytophagaceae bacterium]